MTRPTRPRTPDAPARAADAKLQLDLALQGGGSHGAFTWGVLDRLLEEEWLEIAAVSGTSAGAMNAVVLAQGLMDGGREGARAALRRFWTAVAGSLPFEVAVPRADGSGYQLAPAMRLMLQWTHHFTPEQLNPFDLNPLRDVVRAQFDFERLRRECPLKLFIAATTVRTGKVSDLKSAAALAQLPVAQLRLKLEGPCFHH